MKPPFPLHGGKSRLARWVADHLPAAPLYVEPFAGSSAVLFHRQPASIEVLNDLDEAIWAFFHSLRTEPERLAHMCLLSPYSRREWEVCRSTIDEPDIEVVERARRFFVVVSQGFGSVPAGRGWTKPHLPRGNEARAVNTLIGRFEGAASRLREVHLECRPAADVLAAYDSADAVFYVDPPYLWSTRSWAGGQRRKQDYRVELQTDSEHLDLLDQLRALNGKVVLSGRESDLYRDQLRDWTVIEHPTSPEQLWVSPKVVEG